VAATIAYLRYRERPSGLRYAWTLILFALAVAGKMSVVVLPAIWVALDLFREHRRGPMLWCDKIPHAAIAVAMALPVFGAQPPSRYHPDLSVIGHTFANNLWLLTGFGTHVVYRAQADPDVSAAIKLLYALPVLAALVVPLLLRRVLPGVVIALLYALWLALLPPQVLSFVHPICDRYLFFPSVFSIILIAIGIAALARGRSTLLWLAGGVLVLAWGARTVAYLSEWRDPRSLWFAATTKSQDPNVFQYLGSHYQDAGDRIARYRGGDTLDVASESGLATLVWRDDPRLPALLAEWRQGNRSGLSAEYQRQLADLAWAQFERAVELGSGWLRPKLYLRRGKVQAERGNLEAALVELRKALELSELHPYEADSLECGVRALFGLGMASLGLGRTEQALDYLARAESEQRRGGVMFEPRIASVKAQIEAQLGGKR
jgi:hypothetical protein